MLLNYKYRFQIDADFLTLFRENDFINIPYGQIINIAIPKSANLSFREKHMVYSITTNKLDILDCDAAIKKYNSDFTKFACLFFAIFGLVLIYFGYRFKGS